MVLCSFYLLCCIIIVSSYFSEVEKMSDFLYTKIGRRIRERRESLGLSRIQAVEGINLSVEGLRLIEKGERGMSGFVVIELAKKLQTTTDYILLGTNGEEDTPGFSTPEHTFPTNEEYRKTLKALDQISDYIKRYEGVSTFPTSETEDNKKETNEKKEVFIMWIAICDDEDNFRNDLRDAVYEYSKNKGWRLQSKNTHEAKTFSIRSASMICICLTT